MANEVMLLALTELALAAASDRQRRRVLDCSVRSMAVNRLDMRAWCSPVEKYFPGMARLAEEELKLVLKLEVELWCECWTMEEAKPELLLKLEFM